MKKVLSVILALSVFLVPAGAMSCFADWGRNYKSACFSKELKEYGLEKVQIVAEVSKNGKIVLHGIFLKQGGGFFKVSDELPNEICTLFVKEIDRLKILNQMKLLNCSFAKVVFEKGIEANISVYATFYDALGRYVNLIIF